MPTLIDATVKDAAGAPVPGASVKWWDQQGHSDARSTDGDGYANFGSVQSGALTWEALSTKGFKSGYITDDVGHLAVVLDPFQ